MPQTQNPYIKSIATLYEQARYEEALSRLQKVLDWKANDTQELLWLKLMQGVLQVELSQGEALESFKEALALDKQSQLPVQGSRRLRKLFEQARDTLDLPADKELLAKELDAVVPKAPVVRGPPPRRYGLSVDVRVEVDVLGIGLSSSEVDMLGIGPTSSEEEWLNAGASFNVPLAPAMSVGYTRERLGGVLTVLVQPAPGLRAEGQFHPLTLGWVRPYARLGATAFYGEKNTQGSTTFFGGVSARGALGIDVQWNSRMYAFADVAYDHFLYGGGSYRSQSLLLSVGVGLFP
ncbi:hypothetical protein [Archangium gephyra]|uniref:Branched-chain amino acid ABC transporter, amino acid-binding protein n=1 Tax=Archangium gephyra TaxID=48 RepID=A0AAC8TEP4_9BACT|nr:hypothetical protein [Archangium gephyra]AKJ03147.1 Branched-chain amino acid ABC transporter, amino acid-binding protein [Archangium gephyra]